MLVEVCAGSIDSAINAEKAGADRIELCSELGVGGITPSHGFLEKVMERLSIPVHALIRPRSGDFSYSEEEFEVMLKDIEFCKKTGVKGIVSGILMPDFSIDRERTKKLIEASEDLVFTFHRAFDWAEDPEKSFQVIENLGADYLLSSGQQKSAIEGLDLLKKLKEGSSKCKIMPGGGVNKSNALDFKNASFEALHFSGSRIDKTLQRTPEISMFSEKFLKDDKKAVSDVSIITEIVQIVK